ncbi:MAG: PAS domain-containing protein [Myxococcus sp.]|nr:PAS domain-containing protein [Myxococcus sp.]
MFWNRLTEPSALLVDGLERRQARLLAGALVFIMPVWCLAIGISIATRPIPLEPHQWALGLGETVLGFGAYALSRTRHYRLAVIVLIVTSVIGSNLSGYVEPERVRTVVSMLYGSTGALYAAVFMNTRATLLASVASMASFIVFGALHPALTGPDFVLPMFLLGFILALTVVAAAVRESHLETIKRQSAHLAAIFESTTDAVIVVSRDGLVRDWSPRAAAVFRRDAAEAVGKPLSGLLGVSAADADRLTAALVGASPFLEFVVDQPEGQRSFEGSLAPLSDGSGAVVAVLRDVTARKQMELRLMMSDRLETMGRLVAGVAHEINNPLAYVQANLRGLREDLEAPSLAAAERKELLTETLDGTRRIQTIVKDLLGFSRHTGEHDAIVPVDVERALDSVLHLAQVPVLQGNAAIVRTYSGVGAVMAVEARLGQVFLTLVMNALQALPAEGGRREILVSTRREGDQVVIAVRDFGQGMTPEVRARLFTPFFTTKPVGKGTGLGLSIAHTIVRALGGEIRVESAPQRGALFEVVLPISPAATAASAE